MGGIRTKARFRRQLPPLLERKRNAQPKNDQEQRIEQQFLHDFFDKGSKPRRKELSRRKNLIVRRVGAYQFFCRFWLSPSPPHACGGEGRGEEALFSSPGPVTESVLLPAMR